MHTSLLVFLTLLMAPAKDNSTLINEIESQFRQLVTYTDQSVPTSKNKNRFIPRSIEKNGEVRYVGANDWTSGFYPGAMWYLYRLTGHEAWKKDAMRNTEKLENVQYDKGSHDVGFMIYCSYGGGYRMGCKTYQPVIVQAAKSLITRYDEKVHCIKSWSWGGDRWKYPVIIDNMMNLELLFEASLLTGDTLYRHIATEHANTTLRNHFRPEGSSFHVVDYDPADGIARRHMTFQGYADHSVWSRGQAWGLYGYTMSYRYTRDKRYLEQAQQIAKFIFSQPDYPRDLVPYWDMRDPQIKQQPEAVARDVSAAAIMASALVELSGYSKGKLGKQYRELAQQIVESLTQNYRNAPGAHHGFLLNSSTGNWPAHDEINTPINYADYYYLEALTRLLHK